MTTLQPPQTETSTPGRQEDERFMRLALQLAEEAAALEEVPVGAVLVCNGETIGRGFNQPLGLRDPTAHAEIRALRNACQHLDNYRLPGSTLYVTIEPCTMCLGAMIHARLGRLVFGAPEPRYGAVVSGQRLLETGRYNHHMEVTGGVLAEPCGELMRAFFRERRGKAGQ